MPSLFLRSSAATTFAHSDSEPLRHCLAIALSYASVPLCKLWKSPLSSIKISLGLAYPKLVLCACIAAISIGLVSPCINELKSDSLGSLYRLLNLDTTSTAVSWSKIALSSANDSLLYPCLNKSTYRGDFSCAHADKGFP